MQRWPAQPVNEATTFSAVISGSASGTTTRWFLTMETIVVLALPVFILSLGSCGLRPEARAIKTKQDVLEYIMAIEAQKSGEVLSEEWCYAKSQIKQGGCAMGLHLVEIIGDAMEGRIEPPNKDLANGG